MIIWWMPKEKFAEFERKVNALDPENVSARLNKTVEEIEDFKKKTREELVKAVETQATNISAELKKASEKTVRGEIESLSNEIKGIVRQKGEKQDEKIEKFISSSQKTAKIIWSQISEAIKNVLGPILAEKSEKAAGPAKSKDEGARG